MRICKEDPETCVQIVFIVCVGILVLALTGCTHIEKQENYVCPPLPPIQPIDPPNTLHIPSVYPREWEYSA